MLNLTAYVSFALISNLAFQPVSLTSRLNHVTSEFSLTVKCFKGLYPSIFECTEKTFSLNADCTKVFFELYFSVLEISSTAIDNLSVILTVVSVGLVILLDDYGDTRLSQHLYDNRVYKKLLPSTSFVRIFVVSYN